MLPRGPRRDEPSRAARGESRELTGKRRIDAVQHQEAITKRRVQDQRGMARLCAISPAPKPFLSGLSVHLSPTLNPPEDPLREAFYRPWPPVPVAPLLHSSETLLRCPHSQTL